MVNNFPIPANLTNIYILWNEFEWFTCQSHVELWPNEYCARLSLGRPRLSNESKQNCSASLQAPGCERSQLFFLLGSQRSLFPLEWGLHRILWAKANALQIIQIQTDICPNNGAEVNAIHGGFLISMLAYMLQFTSGYTVDKCCMLWFFDVHISKTSLATLLPVRWVLGVTMMEWWWRQTQVFSNVASLLLSASGWMSWGLGRSGLLGVTWVRLEELHLE